MVLHGFSFTVDCQRIFFSRVVEKGKRGGVEVACGAVLRRALCCVVGWVGRTGSVFLSFFVYLRSPFCLDAIILASCVYSVFIFLLL